jgi:putative endonuclease
MERGGYQYILSNYERTVLYIGVTSTLNVRIHDHRNGSGSNFNSKYKCWYLVHYCGFKTIEEVIAGEKAIKKWKLKWKLKLIKESNPELKCLSSEVFENRL